LNLYFRGNFNQSGAILIEFKFIKAFLAMMRLKNVLTAFADFTWESLDIDEQTFED